MLIERVETGIPGFDRLVEGGFVAGSTNLLAGSAGTGKTIFGLQYLWNGLLKGENGVYLTLEERPDEILKDVDRFGWDFQKYITAGKCKISSHIADNIESVVEAIIETVKGIHAKRFVLDSLTIATMSWKERPDEMFKIRKKAFDMLNTLEGLGVTGIVISEVPRGEKRISRFGFEEFISDSVIVLDYMSIGGPARNIQILKMRRTDHGKKIYPFDVTNKGIVVKSLI